MDTAIPWNPTGNTCSNNQSTFGSAEYPVGLLMASRSHFDSIVPHIPAHKDSAAELPRPRGSSCDPSFELHDERKKGCLQSCGNTSEVNSMHDSSFCCCILQRAVCAPVWRELFRAVIPFNPTYFNRCLLGCVFVYSLLINSHTCVQSTASVSSLHSCNDAKQSILSLSYLNPISRTHFYRFSFALPALASPCLHPFFPFSMPFISFDSALAELQSMFPNYDKEYLISIIRQFSSFSLIRWPVDGNMEVIVSVLLEGESGSYESLFFFLKLLHAEIHLLSLLLHSAKSRTLKTHTAWIFTRRGE